MVEIKNQPFFKQTVNLYIHFEKKYVFYYQQILKFKYINYKILTT